MSWRLLGLIPVAAIQAAGSPTTPAASCASAVERTGLRQPSQPSPSATALTIVAAAFGNGTTGRGGNPSQPRIALTISRNDKTCGCASSQVTLAQAPLTGAHGARQSATVSTTS